MTRLLEIEDLHVYYGNIHALKGIELYVDEGEVVSLIGANGAGKSTSLQTISGLIKEESGEIKYKGNSIKKAQAHEITRMGIAQVPEGRRIFSHMTVSDNILLGAYALEVSQEERREMADQVYDLFPRMKERRKQVAGTLSGGEQQMLAIGRALMTKPSLLLLDEPSMGLSPIYVDEIFKVIKKLNEYGTTILLVEQNANLAIDISDRVYVLETGSITIKGTAEEVSQNKDVKAAYLGA